MTERNINRPSALGRIGRLVEAMRSGRILTLLGGASAGLALSGCLVFSVGGGSRRPDSTECRDLTRSDAKVSCYDGSFDIECAGETNQGERIDFRCFDCGDCNTQLNRTLDRGSFHSTLSSAGIQNAKLKSNYDEKNGKGKLTIDAKSLVSADKANVQCTINKNTKKGSCRGVINGVQQKVVKDCSSKEDCEDQALDAIKEGWNR